MSSVGGTLMSSVGDESVFGNRLEAVDTMECGDQGQQQQEVMETASEQSMIPGQQQRPLSTFEQVFTTHVPILESLLLQVPTDTLLNLYRTSYYLRSFLRSYPTAWKYLSFRLFYASVVQPAAGGGYRVIVPGVSTDHFGIPRHSQPYALDQLLMSIVVPFSPCLTSLDLDNTAVSGQILITTVLNSRRETLEHLSVRGCRNVSLKYHIVPYLTMFGLQYDVDVLRNTGSSPSTKRLALKSLYAYRCGHHRRRPYLTSALMRKDSDAEPTHELLNLCHKLGIWTDTAWCTTPAGRCLRRRGYVSMKVPRGSPEVWVVFDRLWRSKNWIGPVRETRGRKRNGKLWDHDETGCYGEALGTGEGRDFGEGKMKPAHLRRSHRQFVENVRCDNCWDEITERCEQCSILMHCVGCRKTLCASCAFERPYPRLQPESLTSSSEPPSQSVWWAPGAPISPCLMQDPPGVIPAGNNNINDPFNPTPSPRYPGIKFRWCCTEPIFTDGGGINIEAPGREVDIMRAVPLPKGQGWEDSEYSASEWNRNFPTYAYGNPNKPNYSLETGHIAMMKWLFGSPHRRVLPCPRNLCQECYDSPQWKVHCKYCSNPLCIEHDLRGHRLRICGYRELSSERLAFRSQSGSSSQKPAGSSVTSTSAVGFQLPYRLQRAADSTSSSVSGRHAAGRHAAGESDDFDNPTLDGDSSETAVPGTSRASRNLSATNSNRSRSSSPSFIDIASSTEAPKWQGCQSFYCPQYRAVGDNRHRCGRVLRICTNCSVNVCQDCVRVNPPCQCSYCRINYRCPNCRKALENDGSCRKAEEEEKTRREEQWKKDREALEKILERKVADETAGFAHQFFDYLGEQQGPAMMDSAEDVEQAVEDSFDDILYPFSLEADEGIAETDPATENGEQLSHHGIDDYFSDFDYPAEDISD